MTLFLSRNSNLKKRLFKRCLVVSALIMTMGTIMGGRAEAQEATLLQSSGLIKRLTEQATRAPLIVRAKVYPSEPVTQGAQNYLVYPLDVLEVLRGDVASLPKHAERSGLWVLADLLSPRFPVTIVPKESNEKEAKEYLLLLHGGLLDTPLLDGEAMYPLEGGRLVAAEPLTETEWRAALAGNGSNGGNHAP